MKTVITIIVVFTLLINGFFWLQEKENDNKLVSLSERASYLTTSKEIKAKVAQPLEQMILDAEEDGMCLVVISAFRTHEQQRLLYNNRQKGLVAFPGTSEHEDGIAVDFTGCPMKDGVRDDTAQRLELRDEFDTLPEYQWLLDHADEYSFEQSYTAENSEETGFPAEAWHWRYTK